METSIEPISPIQSSRETQPIQEKTNRSINEARRLILQNKVTGAKALHLYTLLNQAEQNLSRSNTFEAHRIARQALNQAESLTQADRENLPSLDPNASQEDKKSPQMESSEDRRANTDHEAKALLGERETRTYRDGSSDSGISFQAETPLTPAQAPFAVRQHELSHIRRETSEAILNGQRIIASAAVHSRVDPRTGERTVDGGRARIVIMPNIEPPDPPGEKIDVKG